MVVMSCKKYGKLCRCAWIEMSPQLQAWVVQWLWNYSDIWRSLLKISVLAPPSSTPNLWCSNNVLNCSLLTSIEKKKSVFKTNVVLYNVIYLTVMNHFRCYVYPLNICGQTEMWACNYSSVIVLSFRDASLGQWLMFLGGFVHPAFEQFLYLIKSTTKNSLFPYRTPEGLKLQEEKVGKPVFFVCVLVLSILAATF